VNIGPGQAHAKERSQTWPKHACLFASQPATQHGRAAWHPVQSDQHVSVYDCCCSQALVATLTHDERLKDGEEVYLQSALLYTTTDGHRRIR
jgi:hypothetical protein